MWNVNRETMLIGCSTPFAGLSILGPVLSLVVLLMLALSLWLGANRSKEGILPVPGILRQQVGQLIVVGFSGTNVSSPGFRRVIDNLEKGVIGGVLFLPDNITSRSQLESMIREVRHCACSVIPLIAIDEEGGTIERLGEKYGFRHIPSAAEIGDSDEENAKQQYKMLTRKLFDVGFNINFAPVVDLNKNPTNPIVGSRDRSFSRDPIVVEKYAKILIEEHHSLGILATLKHFPGHGSSSSDTHQTAADVASSWSQDELVPYQRLSSAGIVDAVMVGHLINELEWGGVATQKGSTAISGLLRGKLNFDGVVISDDLAMDAVRTSKDNFAAVLVSSFNAGVDIALVAHPVREGNEDDGQYLNSAVTNSIAAGEIAVESIRKSWQRVNSLKAKVNSNGAPILPRN